MALLVNMTGVVASLFMNETLNSKRQNHQQQSVEPQTATSSAINHQHGRQAEPGQSATSLPQVPSLGYLTDQDPEVLVVPLSQAFHESCIDCSKSMETDNCHVLANYLQFPWRIGQRGSSAICQVVATEVCESSSDRRFDGCTYQHNVG